MDSPFTVALVGHGFAGRVFHAPLIRTTPGLMLHSIVSSQDFAPPPGIRLVTELDEVLADPRVDAVVVATPNQTHASIARRALEAGKHVLVDKPFTINSDEARALVAIAAGQQRVLSVFQNRRWDADFLTVQALLARGTLGRIAEFHSHFDRHRLQVRDRWRESDAPGAGLWFDLGPHLLDQALLLFGRPQAIHADIAAQRDGARSDDYFDVTLHYPRMRAVLHAGSLVADNRLRFALHGEHGSYLKRGLDPQEDALRAGVLPGAADWGVDAQPGELSVVADDGTLQRYDEPTLAGDHRHCYARWRDAMAGIGTPPVSADEAVQLMELLERAVESARSGRRIEIASS